MEEIGKNYLRMDKLDDAIEIHERGLNLAKRMNDQKKQTASLQHLIQSHERNEDEAMAIKRGNQILDLATISEDPLVLRIQ